MLPSTTVLYMHYRYGWDTKGVGILLAGVGISSLIVQGFLVKPIVRWLKERRAMALGLTFGAAGFLIYGLAPTGPIFWIGVPVMALWGVATPSLQTIMTRLVDATEQGRLQGALASLVGLASLIGPTIFTQTFAAFISTRADLGLPGAPFLLSAVLIFLAMLLAWRTTHPLRAAHPDLAPVGKCAQGVGVVVNDIGVSVFLPAAGHRIGENVARAALRVNRIQREIQRFPGVARQARPIRWPARTARAPRRRSN